MAEKVFHRSATILSRGEGEEGDEMPIRAIFTTEREVPMVDFERWEVVPQTLRMDGVDSPEQVPMLDSHNAGRSSDVLGRGIDLEIVEDRLEGTLDFDMSDEDAAKIARKVRGGFLTDVSIGYEVTEQKHIPAGKSATINGRKYKAGKSGLNVATAWRLREISTTPIGADSDAKILADAARSAGFESVAEARSALAVNQTKKKMENTAIETGEPKGSVEPSAAATRSAEPKNPTQSPAEKRAEDQARTKEIRAIGKQYGVEENKISLAELRGMSVDDFKAQVADEVEARAGKAQEQWALESGMDDKEARSYSINKVIATQAKKALGDSVEFDGVEREAHDALARNYESQTGHSPRGILIPAEVTRSLSPMQTRDMEAGVDSEGGYLVDTELLSMQEYLKEALYMQRLGATYLPGLSSNVEWPIGTNELSASWVDEEGAPTPSTLSFGNLVMTPKRVAALTNFSLQLAIQSSTAVEALTRREIAYAIAKAIDRAALTADGTGNQPTGLLNLSGTQPITFGAAPTWAKVAEFTGLIDDTPGIDSGRCKFASTGSVKAAWKTTEKASGQGGFLLESEGASSFADGKEFVNMILSGAAGTAFGDKVILGDWSKLIIGMWGGLDLVVDPVSIRESGQVRVITNAFADVGAHYPTAFVISTDDGNQAPA